MSVAGKTVNYELDCHFGIILAQNEYSERLEHLHDIKYLSICDVRDGATTMGCNLWQ